MGNTVNEHSKKFEMVQMFYMRGAWSIEKVRNAVEKSWITVEEFEEITGESYE